ncbi:hypothetical protein ACQCX5_05640 [Propionibacteriaceae bacterium G57]|uniref:hypothetical protein n=1 Tax=Aestuariimicrobium sp. G57 TaxID=3418485 RepID=UPI003DA71769
MTQDQQVAPDRVASRPARRWRHWIGFVVGLAVVLAWGIGWGVFVHVRMDAYVSHVVPVGQTWTDPHSGARYTVLEHQQHTSFERSSSTTSEAPQGATYVWVKFRLEGANEQSVCGLQLLGSHRMLWDSTFQNLPRDHESCKVDSDGEFWLGYLVPTWAAEQLVGVTIHYMQFRHNPALALPPPS